CGPYTTVADDSRSAFSRARSLRLARRMALAIIGAATLEKPAGSPRFLSVIRVAPPGVSFQVYVVSIGKGPADVRMVRPSPGVRSAISYVYERRRPGNRATNRTREPTARGGGVAHSTDSMFSYQAVALSGSAANAATTARGRSISISVRTSTGTSR